MQSVQLLLVAALLGAAAAYPGGAGAPACAAGVPGGGTAATRTTNHGRYQAGTGGSAPDQVDGFAPDENSHSTEASTGKSIISPKKTSHPPSLHEGVLASREMDQSNSATTSNDTESEHVPVWKKSETE